ncbi:MAG: YbaB/EbfC family nucleoid-associated protein [Desulfobulbaceae bacterium]|nr:YbaB/EbfC family nucleoid-associated protein [Desulfobulbaceae bacterium]
MDISSLMNQAKQVQEKLQKMQEELGNKTVTGTSGGGMVTVTVSGKQEILALSIENELIDIKEKKMLEDLVLSAVNDGLRKARELGQGEMSKLTGGFRIPGLY